MEAQYQLERDSRLKPPDEAKVGRDKEDPRPVPKAIKRSSLPALETRLWDALRDLDLEPSQITQLFLPAARSSAGGGGGADDDRVAAVDVMGVLQDMGVNPNDDEMEVRCCWPAPWLA